MQYTLSQPAVIPFTSTGLVTGLTTFTYTPLLNGKATILTGVTFSEIGSGLYTFNFTPTVSGVYTLFIQNQLLTQIEVVTRSNAAILQDLQDEAIGSWTWDKIAGLLTLVRNDGVTVLSTYQIVETSVAASRERLT
jgi:hypothetical protein